MVSQVGFTMVSQLVSQSVSQSVSPQADYFYHTGAAGGFFFQSNDATTGKPGQSRDNTRTTTGQPGTTAGQPLNTNKRQNNTKISHVLLARVSPEKNFKTVKNKDYATPKLERERPAWTIEL